MSLKLTYRFQQNTLACELHQECKSLKKEQNIIFYKNNHFFLMIVLNMFMLYSVHKMIW